MSTVYPRKCGAAYFEMPPSRRNSAQVYPRKCGAARLLPSSLAIIGILVGLSPRVRGSTMFGKTCAMVMSAVYPRECGAARERCGNLRWTRMGSIPASAGQPRHASYAGSILLRRSIPASAGQPIRR